MLLINEINKFNIIGHILTNYCLVIITKIDSYNFMDSKQKDIISDNFICEELN